MVSKKEQENLKKVQEERCSVDGCKMEETGVCALHDVEVERRQNMKDSVDRIPYIMTKLNMILGTSFLIGVLIVGSFTYTTITKNDLRQDMTMMETKTTKNIEFMRDTVLNLTSSVSNLKTMQLENIKNSDKLNASLQQLILQQRDYEYESKKRIDNKIEDKFDSWGNKIEENN